MKQFDLENIKNWIGKEAISKINTKRIENGEIKRQRKLDTTELLWLFLNVALYSATMSLHEIIKLAITDLNLDYKWTVSVPAFCKARMRFSPPPLVCDMGTTCQNDATQLILKTRSVVWISSTGNRYYDSGFTRMVGTFQKI